MPPLSAMPAVKFWSGLLTLAADGAYDDGFRAAVGELIEQLAQEPIVIDLASPIAPRPEQAELPDLLAGKLLIGRWRLRFHGIMAAAEGRALRELFADSAADRQAVQRLYAASLQAGLRSRRLLIRARRGNAAPSKPADLEAEPL